MIIGCPHAKMEVEPLMHATSKTNSKWIKDLYIRAKNLKILENIGIKFCEFGLGKFGLVSWYDTKITKHTHTHNFDLIKKKNSLCFKGPHQESEITNKWEKILANCVSKKELVLRTYK